VERRALGRSGIDVSALSLGSWRTYECIPREQGLAVMRAAREAGISFLDDARYDDETGEAPIPTGWSEVVFGELFRAAGWRRDEVVVANKLWWEWWPEQSAADELDASLGRMGLDHVDLIYAECPPEGLAVEEVVRQVAELIVAGKARAWGVLNWRAELLAETSAIAAREGVPEPAATQLVYSLATLDVVEDPSVQEALAVGGTVVVASHSLAGGALCGKYAREEDGRLSSRLDDPRHQPALALGERLEADTGRSDLDATPAQLALAFALQGPAVASVLFGATRADQVAENVAALDVVEQLTGDDLASLRVLAAADA
jgi:aryl-alcohol dehydrogenase-like predicted oxidoreductase